MKKIDKIKSHFSSFRAVREASNTSVALKTEILSVFVRNKQKKYKLIHNTKLRYLQNQYGDMVDRYAKMEEVPKKKPNPTIWTMWWQGYDNMPPVVKACFHSLQRHVSSNVKIVLLTKDNYSDYVQTPKYILDKVEKKYITLTHLSDIIRMACIAEHGGIWLDSTIYVTQDIPDDIFTRDFFSLSSTDKGDNVSRGMWCSFAIGGGSVVFDFMKDLFYTIWKTHNTFIDYFTIDYGLRIFYEKSPAFRQVVNKYAIFTGQLFALGDKLNEAYDPKVMDDIVACTMFSKLSWKWLLETFVNGKQTFYGHIISENE